LTGAWWGGLLAALGASAQPVILHGPVVDAVTYSSARITWVTDVAATSTIRYGLTEGYGATTGGGGAIILHSWYLSGLAPATTYHFRVCSTAAKLERCSGDHVVVTAPAPRTIPAPPEPPRREVDVSMPAGSYGEPFLVTPDCSNLPSILEALASLEGDLNYEIRIPARTVCSGQFQFPKRAHHRGWIVVRSTEADQLPPGVRVLPGSTSAMAVFRTDALPGIRLTTSDIGTSCSPGALIWGLNISGMPLFVCQPQGDSGGKKPIANMSGSGKDPLVVTVANHGYRTGNIVRIAGTGTPWDSSAFRITVLDEHNFLLDGSWARGTYSGGGTAARNDSWTQAPHIAGAELPAPCVPNQWFFKTDVSTTTQAAFWCTAPNQWTNVRAIRISGADHFAAIQFAEGASRYRFIGLEVTHIPTPDPPPPGWEQRDYRQGNFGSLAATLPSNDSIVFDRCDFHGLDYPSRLAYGLLLEGSNVALIDSRVHKVNRWTTKPSGDNLEAYAVNIQVGPGPGRLENNFLEAIGITLFFPDSWAPEPPADYVIRRNYLSHPDKYLYGSPFNTSGKNYYNRHPLELKAGQRMLIEGNIFDGNWADVVQGAMILLTPRYTPRASTKITRIDNGLITVAPNPEGPYAVGMLVYMYGTGAANHDGLWEVEEVLSPAQFKLKNAPTGSGTAGACVRASANMQISDIDIRNNVFRYGPNLLWITGHDDNAGGKPTTKTTQRIRFMNNLAYGMDARPAAQGGRCSPIGYNADGRSGVAVFAAAGMEDLIIRNNTIHGFRGKLPTFIFFDSTLYGAHAGLEVRDNIFTANPANIALISGSYPGIEALNLQWTQHPKPFWVFTNNVFAGPMSSAAKSRIPARNVYLEPEEGIGFQQPGAGDFRLSAASPFRAGAKCFEAPGDCASSGLDMGVNFQELLKALGDPLPPLLGSPPWPTWGQQRKPLAPARPSGPPRAAFAPRGK